MTTGLITEHLFQIDYDRPVITRPGINTSTGPNPGIYQDEISNRLDFDRIFLQSFTVRGGSLGLAGFLDIPVYVLGFGGSYGVLKITRTDTYVEINGDLGSPIKCN